MSSHSAAVMAATRSNSECFLQPVVLAWLLLPAVIAALATSTRAPSLWWIGPVSWWLILPAIDRCLPRAAAIPSGSRDAGHDTRKRSRWFVRTLVAAAWFDLLVVTAFAAGATLPVHALVGAGLSLSIVFVTVLVNVRFLLFSEQTPDRVLATLATALVGAGFYRRALGVDHQRECATSGDPMSARMGESFWKFAGRAVSGTISRSWKNVGAQSQHPNPVRALRNTGTFGELAITMAVYALVLAWAGPQAAFMLVAAWFGTVGGLLGIHYIQHYGLLRAKRHDGAYMRCGAAHAWDDPHRLTGLLTLNATCHALAHMEPRRHYADLHCLAGAPRLPVAFPAALILAAIPPAWFAIMNPRLAQFAEGDLQRVNIDGDAYASLMARYHRP